MNSLLFTDLIIILLLTIVVVYLGHRIRLPVILGFLLTGILAGPHGLGIITDRHEIELLAEIGVILLLFEIGIEFSLRELFRSGKTVLLGGGLQVAGTMAVVGLIAWLSGTAPAQSFLYGSIVALSSTAIVLKYLKEQGTMDTPYGRSSIGVLIFQDLVIVPLLLITEVLTTRQAAPGISLLIVGGKSLAFIGLTLVLARYLLPSLLRHLALTRSRELFGIGVIGFCFSLAWVAGWAGLSVSIGAFLAGLIVSESEYGHQTLSFVLPFRDLFVSLFFISIGLLLDLGLVLRRWPLILIAVLCVMALKSVITTLAVRLTGASLRNAMITGLGLSQIGEFAFLLAEVGHRGALLPDFAYQLFLATAIVTMALTMLSFPAALTLTDYLGTHRTLGRYFLPSDTDTSRPSFRDHLIVIGFGIIGRQIAEMAAEIGLPYCIIELNPETVRRERARGIPIIYGDALFEPVLEKAGVTRARVMALTIPDPVAAHRITGFARTRNTRLKLMARIRFLRDRDLLQEAGADRVLTEETAVADAMCQAIRAEFSAEL